MYADREHSYNSSAVTLPDTFFRRIGPEKQFIKTYGALPCLWDRTRAEYANKVKRNDALVQLLEIYKKIKPTATVEDVRKKINILRSNYNREKRKVSRSKSLGHTGDDLYAPRSWTFEHLRFLDKLDGYESPDEQEEEISFSTEFVEVKPEEEQEISFLHLEDNFILEPTPSKVRIIEEISEQKNVLPNTIEVQLPKLENNPLALEWAQTLDRLDPMQRLFAKKAINDVLFEAELGNLTRNSVQINIKNFSD